MPHGVLYIKRNSENQFKDAFDHYGLSLDDEGLSRLMTPAPHKEPITNKNVITDGMAIMQGSFYKDSRTVSLGMHIIARPSVENGVSYTAKENFLRQYNAFCDVLSAGAIDLKTAFQPNVVYHFIYKDCTQFTEFNQEMAKFILTLEEPNPQIR